MVLLEAAAAAVVVAASTNFGSISFASASISSCNSFMEPSAESGDEEEANTRLSRFEILPKVSSASIFSASSLTLRAFSARESSPSPSLDDVLARGVGFRGVRLEDTE